MQTYFDQLDRVRYEGPKSTNPLAFRHYNPDELVLGKRMEDHLRFAACYWHTFCWNGADMFGVGSFDRPWQQPGDALEMAKRKADVAFEFFHKLNVPYYCFHDVDVSPEGASLKEYSNNFARMVEVLAEKQQQSGVKLLWGTANCFTNPRYGAGAATNPDPEVFSWAATQVVTAMNATHQLGGENYVLWGGREGYETLLNTDLRQEREQIGRFMQLVVEHKHKIGFKGTLLIEPKPQEPTKHQYDYDASTVYGFLKQFGLEKEIKLNIEANHATLAGHSFHHEIATAIALGLFGSVDANRGDPQLGWDTDQFPTNVYDTTLGMYEILKAGGFTKGGLNFDAKTRRMSNTFEDILLSYIAGMDTFALGLRKALALIEDGRIDQFVENRYRSYRSGIGAKIVAGQTSLKELADYALTVPDFTVESGRQEYLESVVNNILFR